MYDECVFWMHLYIPDSVAAGEILKLFVVVPGPGFDPGYDRLIGLLKATKQDSELELKVFKSC